VEILTGNSEEDEVPRPRIHEPENLRKVLLQYSLHEVESTGEIGGIQHSNVIDAKPESEETVFWSPFAKGRAVLEVFNPEGGLVDEALNLITVGRNDGAVNSGAIICQVVGNGDARVQLGEEFANPVRTLGGGDAWESGITNGVLRRGLTAPEREVYLCVGVAAVKCQRGGEEIG